MSELYRTVNPFAISGFGYRPLEHASPNRGEEAMPAFFRAPREIGPGAKKENTLRISNSWQRRVMGDVR
ncbi:MAG: hypothetical protein P4L33_11970 [Capsulimonadaceae bacterium]|nr:hypothetical protein [Capsulimonadaceae bacterium]